VAMCEALMYCFGSKFDNFNPQMMLRWAADGAQMAQGTISETQFFLDDVLSFSLYELAKKIHNLQHPKSKNSVYTTEYLIENFPRGGYAFESLTFSLATFAVGHADVQCVYDCAGSGGDADSNASMVAALFGALHGDVWDDHLKNDLINHDSIEKTICRFVENL
jgi:ADP-ribosylglycohydrolase